MAQIEKHASALEVVEALSEKINGSTALHILLTNARRLPDSKVLSTFRVLLSHLTRHSSIKAHEVFFIKNKNMANVIELCIQKDQVQM